MNSIQVYRGKPEKGSLCGFRDFSCPEVWSVKITFLLFWMHSHSSFSILHRHFKATRLMKVRIHWWIKAWVLWRHPVLCSTDLFIARVAHASYNLTIWRPHDQVNCEWWSSKYCLNRNLSRMFAWKQHLKIVNTSMISVPWLWHSTRVTETISCSFHWLLKYRWQLVMHNFQRFTVKCRVRDVSNKKSQDMNCVNERTIEMNSIQVLPRRNSV